MADLWPVTQPGGGSGTGIDQNLFPFKVASEKLFRQIILKSPLLNLTGTETDRPIVTRNVKLGDGWNYRVGKLNQLNPNNTVENFDQVRGQAQSQSVDYDYVNVKALSNPVSIKGKQLLSYGTPIDLPSEISQQLQEACSIKLNTDLISSITTSNYPNTATQKPSYDRIILPGVTPSRTTYNGYAGINAAVDTIPNTTSFTGKTLLDLNAMATDGGNQNGAIRKFGETIEDQIQPARMGTKAGYDVPQYLFFGPSQALNLLYNDDLFADTTVKRGTISSDEQPEIISGARYFGEFDGLQMFKMYELSKYIFTVNNKTFAWCFLMGAAAVSLGWAVNTWVAHDYDSIDVSDIWTTHEIRGQKCLRFTPKQASTTVPVEQGIIHVFVRLT